MAFLANTPILASKYHSLRFTNRPTKSCLTTPISFNLDAISFAMKAPFP